MERWSASIDWWLGFSGYSEVAVMVTQQETDQWLSRDHARRLMTRFVIPAFAALLLSTLLAFATVIYAIQKARYDQCLLRRDGREDVRTVLFAITERFPGETADEINSIVDAVLESTQEKCSEPWL